MTDPREALAEAVGETMTKDWWREQIQGAKKTKTRRIRRTCPGCKRANDYDVEHEQIDMRQVALLLDQAFGRPAETKKVTIDITAKTITELEEMTDAQLAELAAAEEGQWELLPPEAA